MPTLNIGSSFRNPTTHFQTLDGRYPVHHHQQNGSQVDLALHITGFLKLEGRCLIGRGHTCCDCGIATKEAGITHL
jgi:hypothetical protein